MTIECPSCGDIKCYKHCNNCGIEVYWKRDEYDVRWKIYESETEILHYNPYAKEGCMNKGTKSGRFLNVKDKDKYEYELDKEFNIWINRCGNTPEFKFTFCGKRSDLPFMLEHHKLEGWPCKKKQWETSMKSKPIIKIDVKNHKLELGMWT